MITIEAKLSDQKKMTFDVETFDAQAMADAMNGNQHFIVVGDMVAERHTVMNVHVEETSLTTPANVSIYLKDGSTIFTYEETFDPITIATEINNQEDGTHIAIGEAVVAKQNIFRIYRKKDDPVA